jgi:nitric oxide dioxygenase
MRDSSAEFLRMKGSPGFKYTSSVVWFFDTFYNRLFEIHPYARPLFKNDMGRQGRFLMKMISSILAEISDEEQFEATLHRLVVIHNQFGVKAMEYCIVSEVFFYSLRKCLGAAYNIQLSKAWIRVFSKVLRVIIPKAIRLERETLSDYQDIRFSSYVEEQQSLEDMNSPKPSVASNLGPNQSNRTDTAEACPFAWDVPMVSKYARRSVITLDTSVKVTENKT